MDLNIIYSDNNIAVIEKPAGVPSQPDKTGDADLLAAVRERFEYAGLVHRLDRPVGVLMVFALDKKSEAILSKEMSGDGFIKTYYAVCCGMPKNDSGILKDWLVKNQRLNMSAVVPKGTKNAKEALLEYKTINTVSDEKFGQLTLMEIVLKTGRHHQIRVQTANAGMPLWGDTKYNSSFKRGFYNISPALYSARLEFNQPVTKERVFFERMPDFYPFTAFI